VRIEEWHSGGRLVGCGSHQIFVREAGQGPPLLLIHGFPSGSWVWHRVWPALSRRFRVVAPDLLGFGFSDKPTDVRYTIARQADVVEAVCGELGLQSVHVLAHAYGDSVAQELLARRDGPLRLCSVGFLNGGLFPEANRHLFAQRLALSVAGPLLGRLIGFPYPAFRRNFGKVFGPQSRATEAELRAFWQLVRWNQGERVLLALMSYLQERVVHRERWVTALQASQVPLHLILGPADPISASQAQHWRAQLPDQGLTTLARPVGHYPQFEDPSGVMEAFLAFHAASFGRAEASGVGGV
jgi:pimeloyl-ACP methyl ester carboxylesterase